MYAYVIGHIVHEGQTSGDMYRCDMNLTTKYPLLNLCDLIYNDIR